MTGDRSHSKLQQRSHAGEQLQDEGFAVEDVELPAAKRDALPQQGVALVVGIDLKEEHKHDKVVSWNSKKRFKGE